MGQEPRLSHVPVRSERARSVAEGLSPKLLAAAVSSTLGEPFADRVELLRTWANALVQGQAPSAPSWFSASQRDFLTKELTLPFEHMARGDSDCAESLAASMLKSVEASDAACSAILAERPLPVRPSGLLSGANRRAVAQRDVITQRLLRHRSERRARSAILGQNTQLYEAWHERVEGWRKLRSVFGSLGVAMGIGQGLADGVLRHAGWADFAKMAKWLEQVPQVMELVSQLGRMNDTSSGESITEQVLTPVRRIEEYREFVRIPRLPEEIRGVERSGEIARMLPSESMLLLRPKLKLLWHARRAEEALSTYLVEGTEIRRREREVEVMMEQEQVKPRPIRGPVIAVVDTSYSMHGRPEYIAKALVLSMLGLAHREGRRCYLYGFSGPSNVSGLELSLNDSGLPRLLEFLALSFHGGTDPSGVLTQVVKRLGEAEWKKADVLLVSDGEFSASHLSTLIASAKADGTRFHGVLVGSTSAAMAAICDPLHRYADWMALAPAR